MIYSLFILLLSSCLSAHVTALYLTWHADPTTTMTIHWHTLEHETTDTIYLQEPYGEWQALTGSHTPLHYLLVHTIHLQELHPDTEYLFRISEDPTIYRFRTAPDTLDKPLRFIIGGDADQTTKIFRKMNETIVKQDPLFCVIGGDIAYAVDAMPFQFSVTAFNRWLSFLSIWKEQMITPKGRVLPLILGIGNHDITKTTVDLFFTLFPFPEKRLYRTLDFSSYLTLFLLDTDHYSPIEGVQTDWLKTALSQRKHIPYRFAIYHEGAYPSYYPFHGIIPKKIRTFWCPLFDAYKISAAFENHNHTFKKTHPLTNGEIDPKGIIYFGDGCWGARPRKPNDLWYLAKKGRKNNVYLMELSEKKGLITALNLIGEPLDQTEISPLTEGELENAL